MHLAWLQETRIWVTKLGLPLSLKIQLLSPVTFLDVLSLLQAVGMKLKRTSGPPLASLKACQGQGAKPGAPPDTRVPILLTVGWRPGSATNCMSYRTELEGPI